MRQDFIERGARLCERRFPREGEVERTAEAVNIGADIDIVRVAGLFRREVIGRAHHRAGTRHRGVRAGRFAIFGIERDIAVYD